MFYYKNFNFNSYVKFVSNLSLSSQRFLRNGSRRKIAKETTQTPTTKHSIEEINEKIDLKNLSKIATPAILSTLKKKPDFLKSIDNDSILNSNGEFIVKNLKFNFDAEKKLSEGLNQVDPTKTEPNFNYEDPNIAKSKIKCPGCGAHLHCQSKKDEGFLPAEKFKTLHKKDLTYTFCLRCNVLKTKKKLLPIEEVNYDYENLVINKICSEKKVHVVILIDLLDMPNSIYEGWSKLIANKVNPKSNIDIIIVGNKFDLLPNTGPDFLRCIIESLALNCAAKGIKGEQIKHVELISAKTGYNIENLISNFFQLWNDEGDVYLLGMANAGKSLLYNRLLNSDYCRPLASTAMQKATTSFWPGTTLNMLRFPVTFLNEKKAKLRAKRLFKDRELMERVDEELYLKYKRDNNLKHAECLGLVGESFNLSKGSTSEVDANVDSAYKLNEDTGLIEEGESFESNFEFRQKVTDEAREIYRESYFVNKSTFFYDTPGAIGPNKILKYFSKQELQLLFPTCIIMPRIYWMQPGQTMFVSGLIRIDLLESSKNERVLFSIMTSPGLPVISPFETSQADEKYEEYYKDGKTLRVPHVFHERTHPLPKLESKTFEIDCIGNHKSATDIVFSSYGWSAITSLPNVKAKIRVYTPGALGLELRSPSLLPYVVNMRQHHFRKDGSQGFKTIFYKKPKFK